MFGREWLIVGITNPLLVVLVQLADPHLTVARMATESIPRGFDSITDVLVGGPVLPAQRVDATQRQQQINPSPRPFALLFSTTTTTALTMSPTPLSAATKIQMAHDIRVTIRELKDRGLLVAAKW